MPALDTVLQQKLQLLEAKHQRRRLRPSNSALISFTSNDYLGLSKHPEVIEAAKKALEKYGAGAGASRLAGGNYPLYDELESLLTDTKKIEAACVFGSGYLANLGVIPALVGAGDLIIADKFSHACMLDGAKLSGATLMRFAHNNIAHLRMLLEANRAEHQNCLILTETVFSMDGDRAPLAELSALAEEFEAWLMTDSAHDLFSTITNSAVIQMGTLSKALGTYGGYVCGSHTMIDYVKTSARSLIYSTALPPATIAAAIAALTVIKREPEICKKPLEHAQYFTSLLGLKNAQSAIVPLALGDNKKALAAAAMLEENGFLVTAIRPPTVPENTARLRFAFTAQHKKPDIERLAKIIQSQGWL